MISLNHSTKNTAADRTPSRFGSLRASFLSRLHGWRASLFCRLQSSSCRVPQPSVFCRMRASRPSLPASLLRAGILAGAALTVTCLFSLVILLWQNYSQMQAAQRIAEEVLRFHVIANSDREDDQALKLQVRDALIAWMAPYCENFSDADEAAAFASAHCSELEAVARQVIASEGYPYDVCASVRRCAFPDKEYDGLTFPAGEYEALWVEIGQAQGQNWWCVLYPPLCFTEEGSASVPASSQEKLQEMLLEEDYSLLENPRPRIRFRLLDWLLGS